MRCCITPELAEHSNSFRMTNKRSLLDSMSKSAIKETLEIVPAKLTQMRITSHYAISNELHTYEYNKDRPPLMTIHMSSSVGERSTYSSMKFRNCRRWCPHSCRFANRFLGFRTMGSCPAVSCDSEMFSEARCQCRNDFEIALGMRTCWSSALMLYTWEVEVGPVSHPLIFFNNTSYLHIAVLPFDS